MEAIFFLGGLLGTTPFFNRKQRRLQLSPIYVTCVATFLYVTYIGAGVFYVRSFEQRFHVILKVSMELTWNVASLTCMICATPKVAAIFDAIDSADFQLVQLGLAIRVKMRRNVLIVWNVVVVSMLLYYMYLMDFGKIPNTILQALHIVYSINYLVFLEATVTRIASQLRHFNDRLPQTLLQRNLAVLRCYKTFEKTVESFNEAFGPFLFVFVLSVCSMQLKFLYDILSRNQTPQVFAFAIVKGFFMSFQTILFIRRCHELQEEGKRSSKVASDVVTTKKLETVDECGKLLFLVQQGNSDTLTVSAAGYFNLNNGTLFQFFNLMVTYMIVVIQYANIDRPSI